MHALAKFWLGGGAKHSCPPAPLPTVPKMLIGKVDQCWRIWIFLHGHFSLAACTAISKNSSQRGRRRGRNNLRNGDFGRARKQAKVGEGSETARRLGRFSSAFVASIEQHQELNLTSRYWSTCRSKSIPFFTLRLVLNEKSRAEGNKDSLYYTGRLRPEGVPYFTIQVYKRNFPC